MPDLPSSPFRPLTEEWFKFLSVYPTFQISSDREIDPDQCRLIIDAGQNHFCFAVQERGNGEFLALQYYQFHAAGQDELRMLLDAQPLPGIGYPEVRVFYNHSHGLLVPARYYQPGKEGALLELMRGDLQTGPVLTDALPEMDAVYVYTALQQLHELLQIKYPNASFSYFNAGWLRKKLNKVNQASKLEAILYPSHVIATLWAEGQLLVSQYFAYDTPEDVTWWLLDLAGQWDLQPGELPVVVSGLVETSSPMYAEIRKYFMHVELDERPSEFSYDSSFDPYPGHFFSPIFSLSS